jgi:hypothetical protein
MVYEPVNAVNGLVVSRRQGEPKAELMLVMTNGRSQVLELNMLMLAKLVEQGAGVLARAATELPTPPRKQEDWGKLHAETRAQFPRTLAYLAKGEPPAARSEHDVMKDVCKLLKQENEEANDGGEVDKNPNTRREEYADVANRTQAAPDSVAWNRRVSPRLAVSKRTPSRDA